MKGERPGSGGEAREGRGNDKDKDKDDHDDRGADEDDAPGARPESDPAQVGDGTLSLLFTSIASLVLSIVDFSFGPAQPANVSNLVVSIVTLAALPASAVTTASLGDLLEQLDASNICTDDRSACEALCDTLSASCGLYIDDARSAKLVERNCGKQTLAACR